MTLSRRPSAGSSERPPSRRAFWIVVGVGVAGAAVGIWIVLALLPRWLHGSAGTPAATAAAATSDARKIHATLFYVSEDGTDLVPVSREVPFGATPAEEARRLIEAQLEPAPPGLVSAVPSGTKILALYLTPRGEAFVDLSHEIRTGHTGGSLDEILTVYTIVDAVTVNLPTVTSVQILVDGQSVDTLAGHVDLRHPLGRSLEWVRGSSPPVSGADAH